MHFHEAAGQTEYYRSEGLDVQHSCVQYLLMNSARNCLYLYLDTHTLTCLVHNLSSTTAVALYNTFIYIVHLTTSRLISVSLGAQAYSYSFFGPGTGPILMSYVGCTGNEFNLVNCTHSTSTPFCSHSRDAGVRCPGIA